MSTTTPKKPRVVFIHLDLGIGGAEQLVLSLAEASYRAHHEVHLVTTVCRQDHCFASVQQPNGILCDNVHVWGEWIPHNILGVGTALCSTLRLLYLAHWTCRIFDGDVVVLDVLPTPIPLLLPYFSILFYCHFPDKLLTRDTVNGQPQVERETQSTTTRRSSIRQWYRRFLDALEEVTMQQADVLVVNSNFTQTQVERVFPTLQQKPMRVLYPALPAAKDMDTTQEESTTTTLAPIVSLNRYERKKNIELLLQAYALLQQQFDDKQLPPLIVAGGYDVHNVENVEYMAELVELARKLEIDVTFLKSISDAQRNNLLQTALCVVYTPHLEHFGIVPLESMAAGTPVVAVNSGGPQETVLQEKTGFLCDNTPESFAEALSTLIRNPALARNMGAAGQQHVSRKFGTERFQQEWVKLVDETVHEGTRRRRDSRHQYTIYRSAVLLLEAMVALLCVIVLTKLLRSMGVLEQNAHIVGSIRRALLGPRDEL